MAIASLSNVLRIFGGGEADAEQRRELYKEALLMTLARASSSDANVSPVEVETVRKLVERETGETVTEADVRVAAASELYEKAPLESYLGRISRKLTSEERSTIARGLAEVIKSDVRISSREVRFYDAVIEALGATPSEIAGLDVEQ